MASNSIVIVCNNELVGKALRVKLAYLREVDLIKITPKKDAIFEIESNIPDVVIVYAEAYDTEIFDFIKEIKTTTAATNSQILLVAENLSEEVVVNGFDSGINDFISVNNTDAEFLARLISCMKKSELLREIETKNKLLSELNVLQSETGFYTKEYSKKVIESEILSMQKYGRQCVLMVVSADVNYKTLLTPALLGHVIKKCTRHVDKVGFCGDDKFYILLYATNAKGAIYVYERLKQELNGEYTISVGACETDNLTFEEIDKNVMKSVTEALELSNTIVVYDPKEAAEPMNWLDNEVSGQRNFKFFQAAFMKKLENVIAPVFYQTQKVWEDRLFNTTIEQSSDENQSIFKLKTPTNDSVLKITYPGFAKINIDVIHNFEGVEPKDRISLDLNELDDTKLSDILVNFIKEFQSYTK